MHSISLASGHFQITGKLQAHLQVRLINLVCSNYPMFCGDTLFLLLQCIHLNITIQDIYAALSCFISKTGVCSLETKGKVSSACCTCRNLAVKSGNTLFFAKIIVLLVVQVLCLLFICCIQLLCWVFVNSAPAENDSTKVLLHD